MNKYFVFVEGVHVSTIEAEFMDRTDGEVNFFNYTNREESIALRLIGVVTINDGVSVVDSNSYTKLNKV